METQAKIAVAERTSSAAPLETSASEADETSELNEFGANRTETDETDEIEQKKDLPREKSSDAKNTNEEVDASTANTTTSTTVTTTATTTTTTTTTTNTTNNNTSSSTSSTPTEVSHAKNTVKTTEQTVSADIKAINEEDAKWHTVGIFPGLSTTVNGFIDNSTWSSSGMVLSGDDLPDLTNFKRINLEPGTAYRFRLRAINSCGASAWSEVSSFKTCLPGFPGAPSAIKISKSSEGAHLTWEPPPSCVNFNEIIEYSVYLAVKPGKEKESKLAARMPPQLAFVRVYVGPANQCTVAHTSLLAAHIDCSNKPAIIFRIAARNEKGYGPATQVRWLQDAAAVTNPSSVLSPTRLKQEPGGVSPNKRLKTAGSASSGGGSGGSSGRLMLSPFMNN